MARTGWSTTNFLRYGAAVLTAPPLSMAAWHIYSVTGTNKSLAGIYNSTVLQQRQQFRLMKTNTEVVACRTADGAGSSDAVSSTTTPTGSWFHAAGVWGSDTDRRAFLNGANKGTNAVSRIPSGLDRTSIGLQDNAAANHGLSSGDGLAEVGLWNIALSDADVALLATGVPAFMVRPDALIDYWPLIGTYSPEIDLVGGHDQTIQGALSATGHPAIFYYPRAALGGSYPAAAVGQASLSVTLADATLASAAKLAIAGTLSATLANATLSSVATVKIVGALAVTLANATLSSAAAAQIKAALAATLADASLSSVAQAKIQAVLAATLDDATLASIAQSILHGDLGVTLEDAVLIATGNDGWTRVATAGGTWTPVSPTSTVWTPVSSTPTTWTPQ